jgi:serine/threonine protein kinase
MNSNAFPNISNTAPKGAQNTLIMPDGTHPVPLGSGMITALLGEGGMANVYEIWNAQLEVSRAVKLINPSACRDSFERFQTEMKITAKLHHPNITEIYSVGEWHGIPFIEMEMLEGETLDRKIKKCGALPIPMCTAIGIMMARALQYAHNHSYIIYGKEYHGIIHRDLKPGNIMVCADGRVKLMDFGIARPADASFHTMGGIVLGTLQYLSPEQLNNDDLDMRTDIYSLGVSLYEILTGTQAFPEKNVHRLIVDKSANHYKPLRQYDMEIPPRLRRVLTRCMYHDRVRRIPSAELLIRELEKIHQEISQETPEQVIRRFVQTPPTEKVYIITKRSYFALTASVVIVATAILLILLVARYRGNHASAALSPAVMARPIASAPATPSPAPKMENPSPPITTLPRRRPANPTKKRITNPAPQPQLDTIAPTPTFARPSTSFSQTMKDKYGIADLLEIMGREISERNFLNALLLYDDLTAGQKETPKAAIFKLRALKGLGDTKSIAHFLSVDHIVNDGEAFLARARLEFDRRDLSAAQRDLDLSLKVPAQFLEYNKLKQEVYFYQARCATALFDKDPSESNWGNASGAWYRLKNEMRTDQSHEFFKQAEVELKRISEKYHNING